MMDQHGKPVGMRVVMTQAELDSHIKTYDEDRNRDDALIRIDMASPSGWSVYVGLNHWDVKIPIVIEVPPL